jgi:capsular polysaccharide biosynthesis protein
MKTLPVTRPSGLSGPYAAGRVAAAAQWVTATGHGRVHGLTSPVVVTRPSVPTCKNGGSLRTVQRFVAPAAQVAELPHAQVWGPDGTVVTADGFVVEDLTRAWGRAFEDHPIWTAQQVRAHHLTGTAAVVAARGAATNFSHFLADTLPRIQLIRDVGIKVGTWIVSSFDHPWQRDGLELAGIPIGKTISLTDSPLVVADTLAVPSRTGFAPLTAPWARTALTDLLRPPEGPRHRRILISRNRAGRRRLLNEDEVLDALDPHGFEHVDFDDLPLAEQIRVIHECWTIVAVHGSALGHLLHAPLAGHIVEIANAHIARPDIWGLAALAGWSHAIAPAAPVPWKGDGEDPINHDLTADVAALREALLGARL